MIARQWSFASRSLASCRRLLVDALAVRRVVKVVSAAADLRRREVEVGPGGAEVVPVAPAVVAVLFGKAAEGGVGGVAAAARAFWTGTGERPGALCGAGRVEIRRQVGLRRVGREWRGV